MKVAALLVGWKTRSVEYGVRSVENDEYGKYGVCGNVEYGK